METWDVGGYGFFGAVEMVGSSVDRIYGRLGEGNAFSALTFAFERLYSNVLG
jgi:hypothetical protein